MLGDIHEILKCPVSNEYLRPMESEELDHINVRIRRNTLYYLDGKTVRRYLQAGYITQSKRLVYSVEEGIIVLLSNRAIVSGNQNTTPCNLRVARRETEEVMVFYDQIGWQKTDEGKYEDTARYVDARPVVYSYLSKCNNRIQNHISNAGKYIVDAGCGPIHYDAYRAMSSGYDCRICIDVSFRALREAKKQMGNRGIYLMADISNMPLKNKSVDDVISLHTLYHVPADLQIKALNEIHRILKPAATGVVIYSWGNHSRLMQASLAPVRGRDRVRSFPKRNNTTSNADEPRLYSHTHDYSFFKNLPLGFDIDMHVWSSVNAVFTRAYIPEGRIGVLLLKIIGKLEDYFPHALGRIGQYPLFIIKKSKIERGGYNLIE